jgi:hypothetical protein
LTALLGLAIPPLNVARVNNAEPPWSNLVMNIDGSAVRRFSKHF